MKAQADSKTEFKTSREQVLGKVGGLKGTLLGFGSPSHVVTTGFLESGSGVFRMFMILKWTDWTWPIQLILTCCHYACNSSSCH